MEERFDRLTRESWWEGPSGGREVLQIASPLIVSSISWTILTFTDRMFLAWHSTEALAAAFPASVLWFTVMCFPLGVCMYGNTFVAQYLGSGRPERIGPAVWQAVWFAVAMSLVFAPAAWFAPAVFRAADHGEAIAAVETEYFQLLCWGGPAMLIASAQSTFFSGRGQTGVTMRVDAASAALNILLDYLWIFGHAGFPAAGIAGAAWATNVSLWCKVFVYLGLLLRPEHRREFRTNATHLEPILFRRLLYYGGPSGLQMFIDVLGFSVFLLLVGALGELELAATNLAFNVSHVAFMPIFGLSTAASILVGQRLGEDRPDLASRATWTTCWLSLAYMGFISFLYVVVPDLFLFGFIRWAAAEDKVALRDMAAWLLCFVAAYNLFDALNLVFAGALKGAGDTRFLLVASLVMAALLAAGSWLCVHKYHVGIYGCWLFVTFWVWALGIAYLFRFLQGHWRTMRVVEAKLVACAN